MAQRLGRLRQIVRQHRDRAVEAARIDIERHRAARRIERAFHAAVEVERRIGKIRDAHAIEGDAFRVELERAAHALDVDARDARASDIDAERNLARPLERGAVERGAAEGEHAIDIEVAGLELGVETRWPRAVRRRIGEAALDRLAVEFELQPLDRELLRADGELAAGAQHAGLPLHGVRAAFEPGEERLRIARIRFAPGP